MDKKEIKEKLRKIIFKKLGKTVALCDETPLFDLGVDSYMIIQIVLDIENTFGFEFEDDKLTYNTLENINSISSYIMTQI